MQKKIFISMPYPPQAISDLEQIIKTLKESDFEVILDPRQRRLTEDELIENLVGVYAHICGANPMTKRVFENAKHLAIVSRIGVGCDSIDILSASEHGVLVVNTPGAGAEAVAEFTFALMLCAARKVLQADRTVRCGGWEKAVGPSLFRKNLGIIGLGNIGRQLVHLVKGFNMNILAFDSFKDHSFAKENNIKYVALSELLMTADFITIHMPLTDETKNLIGMNELKTMKKDAILLNVARGGIVNENDLFLALKDKIIEGAGLDVFTQEPIEKNNCLLELENVVLSPHNAGSSREGRNAVLWAAAQNVIDISEGKLPRGVQNPETINVFRKKVNIDFLDT